MQDYLTTHGIPTSIRAVDDLRELYQGDIKLSPEQSLQERAAVLRDAWAAYGAAVETCNMSYRFGDPLDNEEGAAYPALAGRFHSLGENQYEFTKRIYSLSRDISQYDFETSLPIVVAHRATVTKIQRILGACGLYAEGGMRAHNPGDLKFIERNIGRIKVDHAEGVLLPLRHTRLARNILERELVHLSEHPPAS